ncbi:MAG: HAD-IC family P-type ATPase, partial [Gemmataceae bacterium]|nr:HAD-IC family P-type ATPase [Gemmataceae bacterium]
MANKSSYSPVIAGPARVENPHALSSEAVLRALGIDAERGLGERDVLQARATHGYNQLAEVPPVPAWQQFLNQFQELVIWLLLAAALIAAALGEWADTVAILAIVLANALIGFLQQRKAERALTALRKLSAPLAKVIREGRLRTLPARDLVPGDRIELEAGDQVPADARLLRGFGVRVQEAALTGESVPVDKAAECVLDQATALGDRRNMVYMGTVVAAGKASAVVVGTGMNTELGRIAGLLQRPHLEPTPLQRRLNTLGRVLVVVCLALVGVIALLQLARGSALLETFRLAVSLAVAAVPEGLPAVVTITLAVGQQRMVKRHALIRKLASVETLGSVTVICSDKTGTLTRNEMTVREILAGESFYHVTGVGYGPRGQFLKHPRPLAPHADFTSISLLNGFEMKTSVLGKPVDPRTESDLIQVLKIGLYCNHARVDPCPDGSDNWQAIGDPTEAALVVAARKAGLERADDNREPILYEIPFDSERKAMSVVVEEGDEAGILYSKGAPEVILAKCTAIRLEGKVEPLTECHRQAIAKANADMAS